MATKTAGELDRSFGQEGYVWLGGPAMLGEANDVVQGWDNKLYAIIGKHQDSEGYGVAVLENDGRPDDHFEPDGLRLGTFGSDRLNPGATEGERIMRLADGRILTAGIFVHENEQFPAMACYLPNGELDNGFGKGGQTIIHFPESRAEHPKKYALAHGRRFEGIREQPVVGGGIRFTVPPSQDRTYLMVNVVEQAAPSKHLIAIFALGLDGRLITEFGEAGVVIIEHKSLSIDGYAIRHHAQHLYIGGVGDTIGEYISNPLVMKLDAEGSLDGAFGANGYKLDQRTEGLVYDLQIAPGDSSAPGETETIFGIGQGWPPGHGLVVRYDVTSGADDLGFNDGNPLNWQADGAVTVLHACAVSQRRLVIVGERVGAGMMVARFNSDGTLDSGFGFGGLAYSRLARSVAVGVVVDPDTQAIVVCGMHRKDQSDHPVVARFLGV